MILTQRPVHPYRSLQDHEIIRGDDVVECLMAGTQLVQTTPYRFLVGRKASEAREEPYVYDVVRKLREPESPLLPPINLHSMGPAH